MKWQLLFILSIFAARATSQQLPAFKPLRYDEDYSFLKEDSIKSFYRKIKFTALTPDRNSYVSFGGEARLQYLRYKNDLWSDAPKASHEEVLKRYLLHADVHPGKHIRTFAQLQSSLSVNMENAGPLEDNSMELHQGFIELKTRHGNFLTRIGRQEFQYGSQRLVSAREGPNNRQSFDALKFVYEKHNLRSDIFYSYYVKTRKGFFNDRPTGNTRFWGTYIVKTGVPVIGNIDLYYFGFLTRTAIFDEGIGREMRHSTGARLWRNDAKWKYDVEAVWQFGKFEKHIIHAWTASINTSYTFNKLETGLKTEMISGNKSYDDHYLQTFNPLFPRGGYFGLAGLLGPENLIGLHPSVLYNPLPRLGVAFNYDKLWRYSTSDGIYNPGKLLIFTGKNTRERRIGDQYTIALEYAFSKYLVFATTFVWFTAGDYLKEVAAGKTVFFTGVTTAVKF